MEKAGAGHMTKMVHNGIEYGMMQAYAEGFEIMKNSPYNVDLEKVAKSMDERFGGALVVARADW